jgi:hypothetical protein
MSENEIDLLRQQIASIDTKKFDLEAWKAPTLMLVSRIFGATSEHVRQIRELKYDYSSWTLRDTSGGGQLTDPVRVRAREILEAAISEIQKLGVPPPVRTMSGVLDSFRKELTGKEMQDLEKILLLNDSDKRQALKSFLNDRDKKMLRSVLIDLLLNI